MRNQPQDEHVMDFKRDSFIMSINVSNKCIFWRPQVVQYKLTSFLPACQVSHSKLSDLTLIPMSRLDFLAFSEKSTCTMAMSRPWSSVSISLFGIGCHLLSSYETVFYKWSYESIYVRRRPSSVNLNNLHHPATFPCFPDIPRDIPSSANSWKEHLFLNPVNL